MYLLSGVAMGWGQRGMDHPEGQSLYYTVIGRGDIRIVKTKNGQYFFCCAEINKTLKLASANNCGCDEIGRVKLPSEGVG